MAFTFLDQQNKLSSLLGDDNSDTDSMFPLTQRKKELNRGEWQFSVDALNLKEYATGTIASSQLALPSDWIQTFVLVVNNIVLTNDREVSLKDYERYATWNDSRPYYYIWEFSGTRYIKFFSTAADGQTYKLYYFKKPTTELSANTDVSLHPEEYREASVYYAATELMKQIGKAIQAEQFIAQYIYFVQRAKEKNEKSYIDKEYPRPDFGDIGVQRTTDVQGVGWIGN